jgi:hypothetical protein
MSNIELRAWFKAGLPLGQQYTGMYDVETIDFNQEWVRVKRSSEFAQSMFTLSAIDLMLYSGIKHNGVKIFDGDLIKHYVIKYTEQRSYPQYVDFREWDVIEVISEVVFDNGCFILKPIKDYVVYDNDCGEPICLESHCLKDCLPRIINMSELKDRSDFDEGFVEYEGCILRKDDVAKLGIFEIVGNKWQNPELLNEVK